MVHRLTIAAFLAASVALVLPPELAIGQSPNATDEPEPPKRRIEVQVFDEDGKPIEGATVLLQSRFKIADRHLSDSKGHVTIKYPAGTTLTTLGAVKPGVGCDYRAFEDPRREVDQSHPNKLPQAFEGDVRLRLDGIREASVKVIGPDGEPAPGIPVKPWLIRRPDRGDHWNLPSLDIFTATTHNNGVAVLSTIPHDQQRGVQCWPRLSDPNRFIIGNHSNLDNGSAYIEWSEGNSATVTIAEKVSVGGKVLDPDGKPAALIQIKAMGGHHYTSWSKATTFSGTDGTWSMRVKPNGYYIFAVRHDEYAAPAHDSVVVRETDLPEEFDFQLEPARKIHGKVTGPIEDGVRIMLQQRAADYSGLPDNQKLPNPDSDRASVSAFIQESQPVAEDGSFEFHVGPGQYVIWSPEDETTRFRLDDEQSKEFNFSIDRPLYGPITIRVVEESNRSQPVVHAEVIGRSLNTSRHASLEGTTDEKGTIRVERGLTEMVLRAISDDREFAGVKRIGPDAKEAVITVSAASAASGTLLDFLGHPVTGAEITCYLQTKVDDRERSILGSEKSFTDKQGKFRFSALVRGEPYRIYVKTAETRRKRIAEFTPDEPTVDLGNIELTENEFDLPTLGD